MGAFAEAAHAAGQIEVWQLTADGADVDFVQHCEDGGHAARVLRSVCERAAVAVRTGLVLSVKGGVSQGVLKRLQRLVDRKRRALGLPIDGEQAPEVETHAAPEAPPVAVPTEAPANDTRAPETVCPVCGDPSSRANSRTPDAFVTLCRRCRADAFTRRSNSRANVAGPETPAEVVAVLVARRQGLPSPGAPDDAPAPAVVDEPAPEAASVSAAHDAPVAAAVTDAEPAPEAPASPGAPDDDPRTKREGCRWPEGCRGPAFASGYCGPHTRKARELGLLPPKHAALPASVQVQAIVARTSDERVRGAHEEAPVTSPVVTAPSPDAPVAIVAAPRSEGEALASLFGELRTLITRLGGWDTARALAARVERAGGADALLALLDTLEGTPR